MTFNKTVAANHRRKAELPECREQNKSNLGTTSEKAKEEQGSNFESSSHPYEERAVIQVEFRDQEVNTGSMGLEKTLGTNRRRRSEK